jgi:hypothetical protein
MINEMLNNILMSAPGRYNMFSLMIELDGLTDTENSPTIFHEYTHYLQNMTTINGFISMDKYMKIFLKSFCKIGSDKQDPLLPLNRNMELLNMLGDQTIENILNFRSIGMCYSNSEYIFEKSDLDDYTIIYEDVYDHYAGKLKRLPIMILNGAKIPLNETVIKENMALMTSIIGKVGRDTITDDEIDEILNYGHMEYNAIFDYLHNFYPERNIVKLVYCVCEIALNLYPSETSVGNILDYLKAKYLAFANDSTEEILIKIYKDFDYVNTKNKLIDRIFETTVIETQKLFSKFDYNINEFIGILNEFYNYILSGLKYRKINSSIYISRLTQNFIDNMTSTVGSPFLYFTKTHSTKNLSNVPPYFTNRFVYLHGALTVFLAYYFENITECPFNKYGICNCSIFKRTKECKINCIQVYDSKVDDNC